MRTLSGIAAGNAQTDSKIIRAGVIGLGRAGTFFHCRAMAQHPRFHLSAVQDIRLDVAGGIAAQHGCKCYATTHELMGDPEIDLVVLAVPTCYHADLAREAIRRGLPVVVEKPFALSSCEAREVFKAGKQAGVPVIAYHNRRFDPDVCSLRRIIRSGVLGEIVKVSIHLHSYTRRKDWQTLRGMGGGALSNWGAHSIDWCFHLFGNHLHLEWAKLFHVLNAGDAEDSFLIELSAGSASIRIEYMNCAAQSLPKWHVVGTLGTAVSGKDHFKVRFCEPSRLSPLLADTASASDGTYGITEDLGWRETVETWDYWDNCPHFLDALYESLSEGAPLPVDSGEVIAELELMENIRARAQFVDFRSLCAG